MVVRNNKLITCGDSYMSPRVKYQGKHCTEIFASELNFELKTFARGGMSNGGIALQLLQAIKEQPSLIIFNLTYHDRIEFPLNRPDNSVVNHSDIHYKYFSDELSVVNGTSGNFVSDSLSAMLTPIGDLHYPNSKYDAAKIYFKELYDSGWKKQTDCMMMYSVIHLLHLSKIDYILMLDFLKIDESEFKMELAEAKKNIFSKVKKYIDKQIVSFDDPGFHTTIETQQDIAKLLVEHYNKYFK